jgi:hypothetical protein
LVGLGVSGFSNVAVKTLVWLVFPMPESEGLGAFWICKAALTFSLLTLVGASCLCVNFLLP